MTTRDEPDRRITVEVEHHRWVLMSWKELIDFERQLIRKRDQERGR